MAKKKHTSINDYSKLPPSVLRKVDLESTLGTSTGENENAIVAGGWEGTDDATSTAPSDTAFNGLSERQKQEEVERLQELDTALENEPEMVVPEPARAETR